MTNPQPQPAPGSHSAPAAEKTPTPRTDAEQQKALSSPWKIARTLERELARQQAREARLREALTDCLDTLKHYGLVDGSNTYPIAEASALLARAALAEK